MPSAEELRALQRLVQDRWRADPVPSVHVGDLAWWNRDPDARVAAWRDEDGEVVAWGWLDPADELELLVRRGRQDLVVRVLEAFPSAAAVWADDEDEDVVPVLAARGFRRDEGPFFARLARPLAAVPSPEPATGYILRSLTGERDVAARVAVQRAAFTASTTTAERYRRLIATWPYRFGLDWVAEAGDGSFAAFCTAWLDDENAVGELEPVGTHPDHTRRGLARAVCLAALHALREAGATRAVVLARGDAAYPPPLRLYASLGFEPVGRTSRHVRDR